MRHVGHFGLALALAALPACARCQAADAAPLQVHGATTVIRLLKPHQAELEQAAGGAVALVGNGAGRGLQDVLEGAADIACIPALEAIWPALPPELRGRHQQAELTVRCIGSCPIRVIVNRQNPIASLTAAQAVGLFSGTIGNWHEVGGVDAPVLVVLAFPGDGTRLSAQHELLKDAPYAANARTIQLSPQVPAAIAQLAGGIAVISDANLGDGVKVVPVDAALSFSINLACRTGAPGAVQQVIAAAATELAAKP
jgi:phosphate transport system substrate-binding protein